MARSRGFNLTAQINLRGPANIRSVVSNIRRQLSSVTANVNVNISGASARSVSGLNTRLTTLNRTLATTTTNVNQVTTAVNAMAAAMRGIPTTPIVPPGLPRATRDIGAARSEMEEFGRQTGLAIRRFAAFSVGTAGIYALVNAIKNGTDAFIKFDKEMVRLRQVTGDSELGLKRVADEITNLSKGLGVASADLMNVATTLAQAGLSARDTEKALKALALSALAPSFDDMNKTVEGSIALMRQFGIGAGDLEKSLGSINAVAAKFAVEAGDIIAAIQRTGGVFAAASKGVSEGTDALNEFVAIFTSVRQTTRESAETIATGLRTIFTRIQRGGTIEALKEFGITLTDAEGKFVGAYKAIQLLSEGLNRLDPRNLKFSQIVEELGGFRQIGKVIPLIQQFTTAQQALAVAQKGSGSLAEDAATAQLSLANKLSKVREEFLALFREIGGTDTFKVMANSALTLASALIKIADAAKGVIPIIGTIMAIRGLQGMGQLARGFGTGLRRNRAAGGRVGYAQGDMVDVALMPGEAVLDPRAAKRVGTSTLKRMNYADKKMSRGGVAQVPGSGRSDSFYTQLPAGSFVIRKDATAALGMGFINDIAHGRKKFSGGGSVRKLAKGGRLAITDFDMTAAISKQQETPSLSGFRNPKLAVPDIMGASPTGIIKLLKQYGATGVLTARSGGPKGEMRTALGSFFKQNGIMVPSSRLITLGDQIGELSTAEKKARALHSMVKKYGSLDFFDDDPRNIDAAKMVRGVNARRVKVRKAFGGDVQKLMAGEYATKKRKPLIEQGAQAIKGAATDAGLSLTSSELAALRIRTPSRSNAQKLLVTNLVERIEAFRSTSKEAQLARQQLLEKQAKISGTKFAIAGMKGKTSTRAIELPSTKKQKGAAATVFTGTMDPALAKELRGILRRLGAQMVKEGAEAIARAAGTKAAGMKEIRKILRSKDLAWEGIMQEKMIGAAQSRASGGRYDPNIKRGVDFPKGVGEKLARVLGVPPDIALDIVRTVSEKAIGRKLSTFTRTIEEAGGTKAFNRDTKLRERERRLEKARSIRYSQRRLKSSNGGEIPIIAQEGEYVINKKSAQSIGYNNLHAMNKYHSGGIVGSKPQKFALGGVTSAIGGGLSRILASLTDTIRRFTTTIARVPQGGGWLGGSAIPGMPATGTGSRAAERGRTPGRVPEENRRTSGLQSGAFALSMALPIMAEMIAGQEEPTTAAAASSKAFAGSAATGIGTGLAVASMGGPIGIIGGIAAAGVGLVKAFADAENAVRNFTIQSNTDKMNSQLEKTNKSLDKFSNNLDNVEQRSRALGDVLSSISKAENVQSSSSERMVGLFNLFDAGVGSFERSVVLFNNGIAAYLSTTELFGGDRAQANAAFEFEKNIPKLSKERATQFGGAAQASTSFIEAEIKRTGNINALKANDLAYKKMISSLALADNEIQEQIMLVRNNNNLRPEEQQRIIDGIIARSGEAKAIEITNRAMREKAIDDLNKSASRASFSLERMFSEMEQSINRSSFAMDKLAEQSELSAAALSGQAKIGTTRLEAINAIQNPRAYSTQTNQMSAVLGASAFGNELSGAVRGLLEFGPKLEDTIMSTINTVLSTTPKEELNNEMIAARISRAVKDSLRQLNLPPELANRLSSEVGKSLEDLRKSGEDKVDFSELMEKIPALARVVDSAKRAQETALRSLENWQKAFNEYSNSFNRIIDLQIQSNERLRRSADSLFQAQLDLSRAFGGQTNLRGIVNNFRASIVDMTGGLSSVGSIRSNISRLETARQQQQDLQGAAASRGPEGRNAFVLMTKNLTATNTKLRENYAALEKLSQNTDVASAAMAKLTELQQKQQVGVGLIERVLTSTPEELGKFNNAIVRLQANMAGRAVGGGSPEQRQQTLELFNMISPLLGEQEGALKANVLQSMLREIGAPMTPMFAQILNSLRNPAGDPQMNEALKVYRDSLREQQLANAALKTLNDTIIANTGQIANQQLIEGLRNTTLNFESRQLANIAQGINDLVTIVREKPAGAQGLALGGVVYADGGAFIPRGTDTVPAMLTPGEFVVNRSATQKNLPLLKSINSGTSYFNQGGYVLNKDNNMVGGSTDKLPEVQTSKNFYDISDSKIPFDNDIVSVKPVGYSSTETILNARGDTFASAFPDQASLVANANARLNSAGKITRPALSAPSKITTRLDDYSYQEGHNRIITIPGKMHKIPTSQWVTDTSGKIKEEPLKFKDAETAKRQMEKYKTVYQTILDTIPNFKLENDSLNIGGQNIYKSASLLEAPDTNPQISSNGNRLSLSNLAKPYKDSIGPMYESDIQSGKSLINPLGFAQYTMPGGAGARSSAGTKAAGAALSALSVVGLIGYFADGGAGRNWDVVSNIGQMGGMNLMTGNVEGFGAKIYNQDKYLGEGNPSNSTIDIINRLNSVLNIKKYLAAALDQVDDITFTESEASQKQKELQSILSKLYNNQIFKTIPLGKDYIKTEEPITLYNIKDQNQWKDFISSSGAEKGTYAEDFSQAYSVVPVADSSAAKRFPWTKGAFDGGEVGKAMEAEFKKKNEVIKKVQDRVYSSPDPNLKDIIKIPYKEVTGPLYNKDTRLFRENDDIKRIIVPLGDAISAKTNPFAEATAFGSTRAGFFNNIQDIEAHILPLIARIRQDEDINTLGMKNVNTLMKAGPDLFDGALYGELTRNNAFVEGSTETRTWLTPQFAEAIKNSLIQNKLKQMGEENPVVAGRHGEAADRDRRADFNFFRNFVTGSNLNNILKETLFAQDARKAAAPLRLRIPALRDPSQIQNYIGGLGFLENSIPTMPGAIREIRHGRGNDPDNQMTTRKMNPNHAKMLARIVAIKEVLSSLNPQSPNIATLNSLVGADMVEIMNRPGGVETAKRTIIEAILRKSNNLEAAYLVSNELQNALDQPVAGRNVLVEEAKQLEAVGGEKMEKAVVGADGKIEFKPITQQEDAADQSVKQIGTLAFNPYNYFPDTSRDNLIKEVRKVFTEEKSRLESSKNKNNPGIKSSINRYKTILSDMDTLGGWLMEHDSVVGLKPNALLQAELQKKSLDPNTTEADYSNVLESVIPNPIQYLKQQDKYIGAKKSYGMLTGEEHGPLPELISPNNSIVSIINLFLRRLGIRAQNTGAIAPDAVEPAPSLGELLPNNPAALPAANATTGTTRPRGSGPQTLEDLLQEPQNRANGGLIYASTGRLINFQPRGTDTVPAMLTPGEFVVNRSATQKHLPLLKSINDGSNITPYQNGGVVYAEEGGLMNQFHKEEAKRQLRQARKDEMMRRAQAFRASRNRGRDMLSPAPGPQVAPNAGGPQQNAVAPQIAVGQEAQNFLTALQGAIGENGFGQYVAKLEGLAARLPNKIDLVIVAPKEPFRIEITGAAVLEQLQNANESTKGEITEGITKMINQKLFQQTGSSESGPMQLA